MEVVEATSDHLPRHRPAWDPGPSTLTATELVGAFCEEGGMHLVNLREVRFDPTVDYDSRRAAYGGNTPLAWAAVFRRPE